ncbi:hypothetical protein [Mycolicibacterium conceptionense]|uniref:hypothetical protein n=1 Tax=Mycolicibacterium conceptionense TaxID=451644 RepID=UPI000A9E7D34|nr:hypothetical protein [Mycolicibacterium conceptionense]
MSVNVGDIIRLTDDAVENYGEKWRGQDLRVTHVAHSIDDHPGYDPAAEGVALVDTEYAHTGGDVPFSVYEYEFVVK